MSTSVTHLRFAIPLALLLGVLLSGCVSTEEQFTEAQSLRSQGRYAEAAHLLVRVLERDSAYPNARQDLIEVATQARDSLMTVAQAAQTQGEPLRAVGRLDDIANLREACRDVDVSLALPEGYAALRQSAEQDAFDARMREGDAARQAGNWHEAERAYDRAMRYARPGEQRRLVDEARAQVALAWSEALLAEEHYRAAHERAGQVFEFVSDTHELGEEAEALRAIAVERGTQRVAYVPFDDTRSASRTLPSSFLVDVNDALRYDHWAQPPLFLATADPAATWRAVRQMDLGSSVLNPTDARSIGREVSADYVVFGTVTEVTTREDNVDTERRIASLYNTEADTSYVVETFDLVVSVTAEVQAIHVPTGSVVFDASIDEEAAEETTRATYDGDWRTMDLSDAERRLFEDPPSRRTRTQVLRTLTDDVAAEVAGAVYDRLLDEVE